MTPTYEIHYSLPRARRGLPCWAIMETVLQSNELVINMPVASYQTEAEAKAALAKLQNPKGWDVAQTSVEG